MQTGVDVHSEGAKALGIRKISGMRPKVADGIGKVTGPPFIRLPGNLMMAERSALVAHMMAEAQRQYPEL